jgi:hypothetical protein
MIISDGVVTLHSSLPGTFFARRDPYTGGMDSHGIVVMGEHGG